MNESSIKYWFEENRILHCIFPTHDPTSDGTATVADSDPTYGLYRMDDTGPTQLDTGTMNQFDSGTITSQYSQSFNVSNIDGWSNRKPTLLSIEATVNSVTNISHVIIDPQASAIDQRM